jgi:hypothetical protein
LFAAAVLAASTATACASAGGWSRYPGGRGPVDDRAYDRGYNDGRQRGENDARRNRAYDYARHGDYRDADDGYRGYGNRNDYRVVYRQGFVAGYNDGYRRYARGGYNVPPPVYGSRGGPPVYSGRAPRGGTYGTPAFENGYRDGYEAGRDDRNDGDRFDPIRPVRYRQGDRGYQSRYGSRDDYKREYRAAFQQGYADGYYGR